MKTNKKEKTFDAVKMMRAFGAWESKQSADQIINDIRNSRNFNRQIEQF